jgi:1-aminocyclopropane-1-carboxylate deaminase
MHFNLNSSPVQLVEINKHKIYIKRDDLIDPIFSGNKGRKLHYYLERDFPHINTLISYGGTQSNMMYALSCLAKIRNWQFIYFTRFIPKQIKKLEVGNYFFAIQNGMDMRELKHDYDSTISQLTANSHQLLIHQGGHQIEAQHGMQILAQELLAWAKDNFIENFNVFLPSGTGTSALYLQQALKTQLVYTTNCVGSAAYLRKQFLELSLYENDHPHILENNKFRFSELNKELVSIFNLLKIQTGIEFDLIYDPVGWYFLLEKIHTLTPYPTIYIHCGGTLGNTTQLLRYQKLE